MSFNAIRENKVIAKKSEFTVLNVWQCILSFFRMSFVIEVSLPFVCLNILSKQSIEFHVAYTEFIWP